MRCVTFEMSEAEIDEFIRRKRLSPDDRTNPKALGQALHQYLNYMLW
jgi:hypothetical protein